VGAVISPVHFYKNPPERIKKESAFSQLDSVHASRIHAICGSAPSEAPQRVEKDERVKKGADAPLVLSPDLGPVIDA
jgi:hypothetical protein